MILVECLNCKELMNKIDSMKDKKKKNKCKNAIISIPERILQQMTEL